MEESTLRLHWTMENIEKFIRLYRQHECLWNPELESYKNIQMKKSAVHRIVADMRMTGLTPIVAKERIRSIRTMYRRELNKVIKSSVSGASGKYVYKPKLFWFEQMDAFLRPIAISRMDAANLGCRSISTSQNADTNEDSDDNFSFQEHRVDEDFTEDTSLAHSEEHRSTSKCSPSIEQSYKKRKLSTNDLYGLHESQSNGNNLSSEENEFDIFGKFISAQLKKLPLITALQCQQKIQDFLTSKRIEILEYHNARRAEKSDISRGASPFSSFIDVDYEEKPNIVNKDDLYEEKNSN
ncbi:uncharacterized protein LOC123322867 [Coccinella septempunctata]|uniref:uncharacterized protein LOC123322867 n=1 Tax=Coccinella septempunctata TaxID=41139 RepID=UPI001D07D8BE|nr:uncharacterized protein LOC123322867 [Coccinella septempunctata]